jgi:hypothetical protein
VANTPSKNAHAASQPAITASVVWRCVSHTKQCRLNTAVKINALDTADVYELIVERHLAAATVVTSNREPIEWLGYMADPLLAQSAIDRLQSAAHELVLDGESYRQRQKPTVTDALDPPPLTPRSSRRRR